MNKYIKEFGKVLLACLAVIVLIMIPVLLSLIIYSLINPLIAQFNSCNDLSLDFVSFFNGAICSSAIMFFFLIFLIQSKKLKMENEENE